MTDEQWQTAWELFQSAGSVPPEKTEEFLDTATTDPTVRDALAELFQQYPKADTLDRIGQRVGRYVLTELLGEGGMGEVYAARDSELGRFVAIKIFAPQASGKLSSVNRFLQEAKAASALNHPNIVTIHEVLHASSRLAIVMEMVDGTSLRQWCGSPLPLDRLLHLGEQMARALAAAHARGIVHCDIKPENLMVRQDGFVKLLDFGLARDLSANHATSVLPAVSLRYMAPEQSRGEAPSRASDVFSLGIVLYELAAGAHPFEKASLFEMLNALNQSEPPAPSSVNPFVPPALDTLILRMLANDPQERPPMSDVAKLLESRFATQSTFPLPNPKSRKPAAKRKAPRMWRWVAGCLAAGGLVAAAIWWSAHRPLRPLIRFNVDLAGDNWAGRVAISPDGTRLVYSRVRVSGPPGTTPAAPLMATRLLDQSQPTLLAGTEWAENPFFSPDGQWIGFFAGQSLKKISVKGGAPVALCPADEVQRGASWGAGFIIANLDNSHLVRIAESGGPPEMLRARPEDHGERTWRWPQVLPGGRQVLFTGSRGSGAAGGFEGANLEVLNLDSGKVTVLQRGGYFGRYLPTGHLVYVHLGTLFAVRLDLTNLKTQGAPVPILDDVAGDPALGLGRFDFSTAPDKLGILVYRSGKSAEAPRTLAWMDPTGKAETVGTGLGLLTPRISPDGKTVALSTGGNIVAHDVESGVDTTLTRNGLMNNSPVWAPDGKHIAFDQDAGDESVIWWIRADGSGEPRKLFATVEGLRLGSIAPDGRRLAFARQDAVNGWDIWTLPLDLRDPDRPNPGEPEPFVSEPYDQFAPDFSPDGRWIAFTGSTASFKNHIYVREFPGGSSARKWQVSTVEGTFPRWSANGRELLFVGLESRIMRVAYTAQISNPAAVKAEPWSPARVLTQLGLYRNFDVAPGGKHLLLFPAPVESIDPKTPDHTTVLLNFFDELKRKGT